jgi:hypothetical protein
MVYAVFFLSSNAFNKSGYVPVVNSVGTKTYPRTSYIKKFNMKMTIDFKNE